MLNRCKVSLLSFSSDWEEELEFWWKLIFGVEAVGEVDSSDPAVCVDLHSQRFDVVGAVGSAREVAQVELNLVPALVQAHGHGADEGLDAGGGLVVGRTESAAHILVVQHLHLEREVLLQVLYYHHQEWQFNPQCFVCVCWTCYVVR